MKNSKVLVVDDNTRNQMIIVEILDGLVEYKVVSSGEEAIEAVNTFLPDLVLLDIMMPGIDGYEVCRRFRADPRLESTKIILVSGNAMIAERLKGYEVGADEYMTKPFEPEELLAKAKVFLAMASMEKELKKINQSLDQAVTERTQQLSAAQTMMLNTAKMSALGEMAGGVAHEINSPLGAILLIVDQMYDCMKDDPINREELTNSIKTIEDMVKRVSVIIRGLKTFARDGSKDPFESVSVKSLVDETLVLCQERLKFASVELRLQDITDDHKIYCQSIAISQVLLNLIGNACDAVAPLSERWIEISVKAAQGGTLISVTDSGGGIEESTRNKIFNPFFTTKPVGSGTGLGLSISAGIMDSHGGRLSVDADCKNTKFDIFLRTKKSELEKAS